MSTPDIQLPPLDVKCTSSHCEADLHCFKFHSRKMKPSEKGRCRACGIDLVDWDRVHARDMSDVKHTFSELKNEYIRHYFWHKEIDDAADKHARRKGSKELEISARQRLKTSVGGEQPFRDGQQTPKNGNILFYAQHATACCCRTCIEYWHGIPKGRALSSKEIEYFVQLVMRFIKERMPHLPPVPERIPRRASVRRSAKSAA
jgi:hypothetical protein